MNKIDWMRLERDSSTEYITNQVIGKVNELIKGYNNHDPRLDALERGYDYDGHPARPFEVRVGNVEASIKKLEEQVFPSSDDIMLPEHQSRLDDDGNWVCTVCGKNWSDGRGLLGGTLPNSKDNIFECLKFGGGCGTIPSVKWIPSPAHVVDEGVRPLPTEPIEPLSKTMHASDCDCILCHPEGMKTIAESLEPKKPGVEKYIAMCGECGCDLEDGKCPACEMRDNFPEPEEPAEPEGIRIPAEAMENRAAYPEILTTKAEPEGMEPCRHKWKLNLNTGREECEFCGEDKNDVENSEELIQARAEIVNIKRMLDIKDESLVDYAGDNAELKEQVGRYEDVKKLIMLTKESTAKDSVLHKYCLEFLEPLTTPPKENTDD